MRTALFLAALLLVSQSQAATLSLTHETTLADHLVVITSFVSTTGPAQWSVRDAESDFWLDLGYHNVAPPGQGEWVPQYNFAVPTDGVPTIELNGFVVTHPDYPIHLDLSQFVVAGDQNVQLSLPITGPWNGTLTFISPNLGTVVLVPEPATLALCLPLLGSLVHRKRE